MFERRDLPGLLAALVHRGEDLVALGQCGASHRGPQLLAAAPIQQVKGRYDGDPHERADNSLRPCRRRRASSAWWCPASRAGASSRTRSRRSSARPTSTSTLSCATTARPTAPSTSPQTWRGVTSGSGWSGEDDGLVR